MPNGSSPPGRSSEPGRLGSYSRWAEPVMLVLAIASVPLFLLEHRHWLAAAAGWVVVAVFFADLAIRVVLVDGSRRSYLVRHWYDVAIVVLSVLPVARPLSLNPPTGLWDRRFGSGWPPGWCVWAGRWVSGRVEPGLGCCGGLVAFGVGLRCAGRCAPLR